MRTPWSNDRGELKRRQPYLQDSRGSSGLCWRMQWEQASDDKGSQKTAGASAGAPMNSLRFDDMAALTGWGIDFATACAVPNRALRTVWRSYPAGAFGSEVP